MASPSKRQRMQALQLPDVEEDVNVAGVHAILWTAESSRLVSIGGSQVYEVAAQPIGQQHRDHTELGGGSALEPAMFEAAGARRLPTIKNKNAARTLARRQWRQEREAQQLAALAACLRHAVQPGVGCGEHVGIQ
eukprot:s7341_g6.t1